MRRRAFICGCVNDQGRNATAPNDLWRNIMRGFHSIVDEIRQDVFKEVAKLAYEGGDFKRVDMIPYEMVRRDALQERSDVFLQRAIISERVRLALGMPFVSAANQVPISASIAKADIN